MRFFSIAMVGLLSVAVARAETATELPKILKADFVKEIQINDGDKLLGSVGDEMYWLKKSGAVEVVDKDGKSVRTLPSKDGKEAILKQPEAVAAGDGVVYVVDSDLEQVVVFSSAGKYLYSFNSKSGGFFSSSSDELSELKSPHGVAFHEGVVYVTDTGNKRIQLFGANGVFLNAFELKPGITEKSERDKDVYRLKEPTDIGVDFTGRVYVLDADDGLVKMYAPNGDYVGYLPGLKMAQTFKFAADGIFVAERDTFVVRKYDFNGKLQYQFGSRGEGKGQFKSISGLAALPDHAFFVGDARKGGAAIFMADVGTVNEAIPKWPSFPYVQWRDMIPSVTADKLAWNGKDTLYALDRENKTILRIRAGKTDSIKPNDIKPVSLAVDKAGGVWALDKKKNRIVKLNEAGQVIASMGSEGSGAGQFDEPVDIAVSNAGNIFVADTGNKSVLSFSADGVFLRAMRGSGANAFEEPASLAFDAQDFLYVLDKYRANVTVFSPQGELLFTFGKQISGEVTALVKPVALTVVADEVLVLDGNRVKVFSRKGKYLRAFAAKGKGSGEVDKPVAITAKGNASVLIAEQNNNRIQTFALQFKPAAPGQLTAQGGVHSAQLQWEATPHAYIKQYVVYRSKSENGGYERIGTSATNQFINEGLDADTNYFYRVAAETEFGLEGATSAAVSAVPQKYLPKPLDAAQVESTPWQLTMSWTPVDSKYFSAYQVYQKDGEVYTKIGESIKPVFIKDGLTPDTKYTFFVSVRSTDGTESEKLGVTGTTQAFTRPPLEIEVLNMRDIFSNTYKLYEQDGLGTVKITNNTNKPIEQIRVQFTIKNFMDFPVEQKIDQLLPGESKEIRLKSVFNNSILTVTEDTSVQASIDASYFENGAQVAFNKSSTLTVYEKHRLIWDEHGRFASFITPKDTPIISFVRSVITQYKETKDEALLSAAVFNAMGAIGMTYIPNPNDPYQIVKGNTKVVDYIQFPRETLERKSGDCVDLVGFYITALESMGVTTRAIEVPGHMLMMLSTDINADPDGYTMDDMYVVHEGKLWIPVETTLVGKSFVKAWEAGSAAYHKWKDSDLTILNVEDEWQTYKPATLPDVSWKPIDVSRDAIEKMFPNEFLSMLKISLQTKTRRYTQAIAKDPTDVEPLLQMGIIMSKGGDQKEGMQYFDKVLSLDPKNPAALNNRGNLFMLQDRYRDAQKAYLAAAQSAANDAEVWVNLARAYKATKDTRKAKEAISKAQGLDPSVKRRYKALVLELTGTL
jgi:DNA-binding beta-propeller fold protein YncE